MSHYELRTYTLPSSTSEVIRLSAAPPRRYDMRDRKADLSYGFEARAVSAEGPGAWSPTLWVESGAQDLPNTPVSVGLVDGSESASSFQIEWSMPDDNRWAACR